MVVYIIIEWNWGRISGTAHTGYPGVFLQSTTPGSVFALCQYIRTKQHYIFMIPFSVKKSVKSPDKIIKKVLGFGSIILTKGSHATWRSILRNRKVLYEYSMCKDAM